MSADKTEVSHPFPPDVDWEELKPLWEAARRGEMRLPRCRSCGRFQWYPQPMCPNCQGMDMDWTTLKGTGTLYTYTILRRPFLPGFEEQLPMIIGLVEFDDAPGPRLVTNVVDCSEDEVEIGAKVEITYREVAPNVTLPYARLVN